MSDADAVDPAQAPGYLLRRAQQVHTECWNGLVDGVTGPQYAVLVVVASWPGLEQGRAGELASLDKATMAGVVHRLVGAGWIDRVPDSSDKRRRLLDLTPAGRRDLPTLTRTAAEVQRLLLSPIIDDDAPAFVGHLAVVARVDVLDVLDRHPDVDVLALQRTPGYLVRRAQQLHTSYWAELVRDLSGPQYAVMTATLASGVATKAQIGAVASLDPSTTGHIVSRLVAHGWLEPVENAEDRRSRPVQATRPARSAIRLLREPVLEVQRRLLTPLDAQDRERFVESLGRVARLGAVR